MAYKPKAGATMAAPNVIPMADIMLVLLIIFMVVTPMLSHGQNVNLAHVDRPDDLPNADKDDAIIVAVDREGRIYIGTTQTPEDQLTAAIRDKVKDKSTRASSSRATAGRSILTSPRLWTMSAPPAWMKLVY